MKPGDRGHPARACCAAPPRTATSGTKGTASGAAVNGYQVAGKTGTAQQIDPGTNDYSADAVHLDVRRTDPGRQPAVRGRDHAGRSTGRQERGPALPRHRRLRAAGLRRAAVRGACSGLRPLPELLIAGGPAGPPTRPVAGSISTRAELPDPASRQADRTVAGPAGRPGRRPARTRRGQTRPTPVTRTTPGLSTSASPASPCASGEVRPGDLFAASPVSAATAPGRSRRRVAGGCPRRPDRPGRARIARRLPRPASCPRRAGAGRGPTPRDGAR